MAAPVPLKPNLLKSSSESTQDPKVKCSLTWKHWGGSIVARINKCFFCARTAHAHEANCWDKRGEWINPPSNLDQSRPSQRMKTERFVLVPWNIATLHCTQVPHTTRTRMEDYAELNSISYITLNMRTQLLSCPTKMTRREHINACFSLKRQQKPSCPLERFLQATVEMSVWEIEQPKFISAFFEIKHRRQQ